MKQIALLKKKPGLTQAEFIRIYEQDHAPLIGRLLPFFSAYRRSYPVDGKGWATHDVLMEMWFDGPGRLGQMSRRMGEEDIGAQMARDEERLFDRSAMLMFTVEEQGAPWLPASSDQGERRLILFGRKDAGIDRRDFRMRYEQRHVPAFLRSLDERGYPAPTCYRRNHVVPDGTFDMSHRDGPAPALAHDVITELCFPADISAASIEALVADSALLALEMNDLIDPAGSIAMPVDTYVSSRPVLDNKDAGR